MIKSDPYFEPGLLPGLGNKPKKFNFVHWTVSLQEAHAGGAQDHIRLYLTYGSETEHEYLISCAMDYQQLLK